MGDVEQLLGEMPDDVGESVRWLFAQGAQATSVVPRHGMGFAALEAAIGEIEVRVVSDRDQWSLDLRKHGQEWVQVEWLFAALTRNETVLTTGVAAPVSPLQLPPGMCWRTSLPIALNWLRTTPDTLEQLSNAARLRDASRGW